MLGRPPAAQAKLLYILLSGNEAAQQKAKPALESISQKIFSYGENVAIAATVKIIMNFMIFTTVELLSEIMLLSEKADIDKSVLLETITSTIFTGPGFKNYGNLILKEEENPNGFATSLASKDLRLLQETASDKKVQMPLADLIQSHFHEIINNGGGKKDVSLLISHLRETLVR